MPKTYENGEYRPKIGWERKDAAREASLRAKQAMSNVLKKANAIVQQGDLLDLTTNIGLFRIFLEEMADRLDEHDTPNFRARALELFNDEKYDELRQLLEKGASRDSAWRKILEVAERQANIQVKASELLLKNERQLSARQVIALFSSFMLIVAEESPSRESANRIMTRIWKDVFGQNPHVAGRAARTALPRADRVDREGDDSSDEAEE